MMALAVYGLLSAVFMLLDTIPLVAKFSSKKGPYDALIEREEREWFADDPEEEDQVPAIVLSDLHPMEAAREIEKLTENDPTRYPTNQALASHFEVSVSTISKYQKLLKVNPPVQKRIAKIRTLNLDMAYRVVSITRPVDREAILVFCEKGASAAQIREALRLSLIHI